MDRQALQAVTASRADMQAKMSRLEALVAELLASARKEEE